MRKIVGLVLVILLASAAAGCASPSAPTAAKVAVPMTPVLVTEDTPTPTPTPTVAPTPTVTPPPVACEPVVLAKVTDDTAKFKGIAEFTKLGDSRAFPSGERVFTALLAGSAVVVAEMEGPTPIVLVSRGSESSRSSLAFTEGQVYSVRLTCISEGSKAKTEEVRFFFAGNEPYIFFPK